MFVRCNMCIVVTCSGACIHMYLTILVSFDCVDTKIGDRREVQCQCKKMYKA